MMVRLLFSQIEHAPGPDFKKIGKSVIFSRYSAFNSRKLRFLSVIVTIQNSRLTKVLSVKLGIFSYPSV